MCGLWGDGADVALGVPVEFPRAASTRVAMFVESAGSPAVVDRPGGFLRAESLQVCVLQGSGLGAGAPRGARGIPRPHPRGCRVVSCSILLLVFFFG